MSRHSSNRHHRDSERHPDEIHVPQEEIAQRAYMYWAQRNGRDGSAEEDWLRAEHELRSMKATGTSQDLTR